MQLSRRHFIKASLAFSACALAPGLASASRPHTIRALRFYNTHTGETLKAVYWEKGRYIPGALKAIAHVLRDHRNNEMHPIDPSLLDLLAALHRRVGSNAPFDVISGYRSPGSNALLRATTDGVAAKSLHVEGRAIDIRLADRPLSALHEAAWDMQQGGVGFYPASGFVHVDNGRVRRW